MAPLTAPAALQACGHLHMPATACYNSTEASITTCSKNLPASLTSLTSHNSCPEAYLRLARSSHIHQPQAGMLRHSKCLSAPTRLLTPLQNFGCDNTRRSSSSLLVRSQHSGKQNLFSASGIMGAVPTGTGTVAAGILVVAASLNDPFFQLGLAVAIPTIAGAISGAKFRPDSWYFELKKPWWDPPAPVFGGAWGILYPLMGVASWLVWTQGGFRKQAIPLGVYALQLVFNLMWPAAFFGKKNMRLALFDILALFVTLVSTTILFRAVNPLAGKIMLLYLAWVAFATALNVSLLRMNQMEHTTT